jgi:hypothetical protein
LYETLVEGAHRNHDIQKVSAMIDSIKLMLNAKLLLLDKIGAQIGEKANEIWELGSSLSGLKDDSLLKTYEVFQDLQTKYESTVAKREKELRARKRMAELRGKTLERLEGDRQSALDGGDIGILFRAEEFCDEVREITGAVTDGMPIIPDTPVENELVPEYECLTIAFKNFRSIKDIHPLISDPLDIDGNRWKLKLFPFGHGDQKGAYAAVFIELIEGYKEPAMVHYRVEIEGCESPTNLVREFTAVTAVGQSWGWKKFHLTSSLQSPKYVDDNGTLRMIIGIRPESYYILWRWLKDAKDGVRRKYMAKARTLKKSRGDGK